MWPSRTAVVYAWHELLSNSVYRRRLRVEHPLLLFKSCWSLLMKELFNTGCLDGLIVELILPTLRLVMPVFSVSRAVLFAKTCSVTGFSLSSLFPPPPHIFLCFTLCCFHFGCRIAPISRGNNSPSIRFTYSTAVLLWWYHLPWARTSQFPAATALS